MTREGRGREPGARHCGWGLASWLCTRCHKTHRVQFLGAGVP